MRIGEAVSAGLAMVLFLGVTASAKDGNRELFPRGILFCSKLDLPLFTDPKERKPASPPPIPYYIGSDKSIEAESGTIQTIAHVGYIGLAAAGAFVNPAFLIIAAYHAFGLVKQAKSSPAPERSAELTFLWSRN